MLAVVRVLRMKVEDDLKFSKELLSIDDDISVKDGIGDVECSLLVSVTGGDDGGGVVEKFLSIH